MNKNFTIRTMTEEEVGSIAIDWAAREGWNPGLNDASSFYSADPQGFLVGLLDNQPIACISAVAYDATFGFLGFYIVKPEYRGLGYGLKLWNAALDYLGTRNIGLDGVVEQQENYRKSGFTLAYNNIRFEATVQASTESYPGIESLADYSFDAVSNYDAALFPAPRRLYLRHWLHQPDCRVRIATHENQVTGYGVIRRCRFGYKIGPLFADTPTIAADLYDAICQSAGAGETVYLDVPQLNKAAMELANSRGMHKVFETARMYTQSQPIIDMNKIFGVTSFELG